MSIGAVLCARYGHFLLCDALVWWRERGQTTAAVCGGSWTCAPSAILRCVLCCRNLLQQTPFCSNLPKTCRSVLYTPAKSGPARTGFGQKRVLLLQGWSPLLGRRPRVRLRRLGCRWCSKCHAIDTDICGGYTCATYLGTRDRPLQRSQRAC